jgi:hypothetical protein
MEEQRVHLRQRHDGGEPRVEEEGQNGEVMGLIEMQMIDDAVVLAWQRRYEDHRQPGPRVQLLPRPVSLHCASFRSVLMPTTRLSSHATAGPYLRECIQQHI